jgi:hypothetical protein
LQTVVELHELDLLPRAAAVGGPAQVEGAEDGDVTAAVQLGQAVEGAAVGQADGGALVAAAVQGEEELQGLADDAQDLVPDGAFDLVDGRAGAGRPVDEGAQVRQGLLQFGVEGGGRVWHAHKWVSWASGTLQLQPHV